MRHPLLHLWRYASASELVIIESRAGDAEAARARLEAPEFVDLLDVDEQSEELARPPRSETQTLSGLTMSTRTAAPAEYVVCVGNADYPASCRRQPGIHRTTARSPVGGIPEEGRESGRVLIHLPQSQDGFDHRETCCWQSTLLTSL